MTTTLKRYFTAAPVLPTLAALALVPLFSASSPSTADAAACGPRKALVAYLTKRYKEHPKAIGLVSRNSIMEIMVSKRGSWSILVTTSTGRTCIVAAGQDWEDLKLIKKVPAGTEQPA